jgi:hypothetical protein
LQDTFFDSLILKTLLKIYYGKPIAQGFSRPESYNENFLGKDGIVGQD